jgi:hypothetical protein
VAVLLCACAFGTVTIDTVPIGDLGNLNDPKTQRDSKVSERFM